MAVDPEMPFNREEMYLAAIAGEGTEVPPCPWSRKEAYLADIAGRLDDMDERIAALSTDLSFKGGVETEDDLPEDAAVGDTYITEDTGVMYVWTGEDWVALGGTGINVVQTTGTSTTDVMSQKAATNLIYPSGYETSGDAICIGKAVIGSTANAYSVAIGYSNSTRADGQNSIALGGYAVGGNGTASSVTGGGHIAIGDGAKTGLRSGSGEGSGRGTWYNIAIGQSALGCYNGAIALGAYSQANAVGEMNIGSSNTSYGYNSSNYRLLTGVYDGQSAHDAATKGQLDGRVLQNAGAPTTATVGTVGQLLEDTTNGKLYQCTAIVPGTDPDPDTYTWSEVGGSSGPTVVQTTGTSTTDVMSQNATTDMVYADPGTNSQIRLGAVASVTSSGVGGVAIGTGATVQHKGSVALGYGASTSKPGEVCIKSSLASFGHNNTLYRLLTGVHDPESAHDAATKGYVDGLVGNIETALNAINNGTGA